MTDRATVSRWLAGYEAAWRTPGTEILATLFTGDASYLHSPYEQPVSGLEAIRRMWEDDREGPDEVFTLATEILAVDGPVAVVRAEVRYGDPSPQEYRDLWIIQLTGDGRCSWFEEWPYWPGRPYSARGNGKLCGGGQIRLVIAFPAASMTPFVFDFMPNVLKEVRGQRGKRSLRAPL